MSTRSRRLQSSSGLGLASIVLLSMLSTHPLFADAIPYGGGAVPPQVATYAPESGGVDVYFFGRGGAIYTDYMRIYDVNTGYRSGDFFNNQSTTVGTTTTIGNAPGQINAGDQLIFYIDSPAGLFASAASYSADGINHGYITSYSGGVIGGIDMPPGTFVGMEDMLNGGDKSYCDDELVFTGTSDRSIGATPAATPEPNSLWLFGTGILSLAGIMQRKLHVITS